MDTTGMLHLAGLDTEEIFSLVLQTGKLKDIVASLNEAIENASVRHQIVRVFEHYDLGRVTDVYEIFGGYVNRSFGVYTEKDGWRSEYFVRMYKKGVREKEIQLEHLLIDFAIANGLEIAAGPIRTKDRKTYVKLSHGAGADASERFFAIYDFLSGEDKYTWDNPTLADEEYTSAAEVLAIFHNASRNFDPQGRERLEPRIMQLLPLLPALFQDYAKIDNNTKFHSYFLKNLEEILAVIAKTRIPDEYFGQMPLNPIHSDFHPGNLKFQDNRVVGIFDFDWAKIDLRLFDVCLALVYCCCSWQDETDGVLLLDKCTIFLQAYQETLRNLGGLSPLNEVETEFMPTMLAAANMYLINWIVNAYYTGSNLNVYEYLAYLQHNVRLMRWIENHEEDLYQMAKSI